jgi:hypothetical protein
MSTSTRINAFLWNRMSQGYSRVVKDAPPFEGWRRWRAGQRDHEPVAYRTPASSPVRELPGEPGDVAATAGERTQDGCEVRRAATRTRPAVAAAATASSSSGNDARCGVPGVNNNEDNTMVVLTTTLAGPSSSQEWDLPLPFPTSELSSPVASQATSTGSQGRVCPWPIDFKLNAPLEDMRLTTIQCTFDRIEDVKDFSKERTLAYGCHTKSLIETTLQVVYASNPS